MWVDWGVRERGEQNGPGQIITHWQSWEPGWAAAHAGLHQAKTPTDLHESLEWGQAGQS